MANKYIVPMLVIAGITLLVIFALGNMGEGNLTGSTVMDEKTFVTFDTNKGKIVIEMAQDMPITTGNFIKLVKEGYYDGTLFHRVIDSFMIQGGDPLTKDSSKKNYWGTGGPGYKIKDEFSEVNRNDRGTISMANAGPNTGGSQFFINTVNNNFLDGKHPVFGKVVEGMEIVDVISKVETDAQDRPLEPVRINKATLSN
jgi:peptidylprolyl isomerase